MPRCRPLSSFPSYLFIYCEIPLICVHPCYKTAPPVGCTSHDLARTISRRTISVLFTPAALPVTSARLCAVLFKALSRRLEIERRISPKYSSLPLHLSLSLPVSDWHIGPDRSSCVWALSTHTHTVSDRDRRKAVLLFISVCVCLKIAQRNDMYTHTIHSRMQSKELKKTKKTWTENLVHRLEKDKQSRCASLSQQVCVCTCMRVR